MGKHDYVLLCEPEYTHVAEPEGASSCLWSVCISYELYLDNTLSVGSSIPSQTFENELLCSQGPNLGGAQLTFVCVYGVRCVWALRAMSFRCILYFLYFLITYMQLEHVSCVALPIIFNYYRAFGFIYSSIRGKGFEN